MAAPVVVFLAPGAFGAGGQFFDANGAPLNQGQISTFLAGTNTPAVTLTGPGLTQAQNPNPIVLGPDGRPPNEIWIPQGVAMKFIVSNSLGAQVGPTYDNLSGVNDTTFAVTEWTPLPAANSPPTQLTATSFSVPGNVAGILHADRRIQTINAGGTLYGAVVSSSFAAGITTVVVRIDTGQALDAGLSAVLYGFVSAFPGNTSVPMADTNPITGTTDATKRTRINSDRIATATTRTLTMQDADYDMGDPGVCDARLSFTQGIPYQTADVTGAAATALFLQPVRGSRIALLDVTTNKWNIYPFTQALTVAVPNTTNQMYDVFASASAGVLSLSVLAWTNDTTRATLLAVQDGVFILPVTGQRYLGSFRTTGVAGQSEDSVAKRYLWNYYNRALRKMLVQEATATWTYTTAAYRQANANPANQLDFVVGIQESPVKAMVNGAFVNNVATNIAAQVGIGVDSTTVNSADLFPRSANSQTNAAGFISTIASWEGFTGVGRHILAWLEISPATNTTTWSGNSSDAGVGGTHSGIAGELWG